MKSKGSCSQCRSGKRRGWNPQNPLLLDKHFTKTNMAVTPEQGLHTLLPVLSHEPRVLIRRARPLRPRKKHVLLARPEHGQVLAWGQLGQVAVPGRANNAA